MVHIHSHGDRTRATEPRLSLLARAVTVFDAGRFGRLWTTSFEGYTGRPEQFTDDE
jgi:hypothetical protein